MACAIGIVVFPTYPNYDSYYALLWGREIVHGVMRAGTWLATPFRHVFGDTDPRERLTENWLLAAGVYLAGGGILAWIVER